MLKNNLRSCLDCVSNLPFNTFISYSTALELYIILKKSDIMTDAVTLDRDFLGTLWNVIAAIMPNIYNAGPNIQLFNYRPHPLA